VLQNALRSDDDGIAAPVSALGIGEYGWVQGLDFVVFFALMLAFAVGRHRGIRPSRLGWLGPMLFAVAVVGLFDAAFPLGTLTARSTTRAITSSAGCCSSWAPPLP
jgi:hypothetical protein